MITELSARAREVLRLVVDSYVETGEPVGSKTVSGKLGDGLSPATIRHVMAELEERGLLYSPHTSAGRIPTDSGLTVFVEGILEFDEPGANERALLNRHFDESSNQSVASLLEKTGAILSGLSSCAGLVVAPTPEDQALKHIEFIELGQGRVLAVLVNENGLIENRVIETGRAVTAFTLTQAANYLNHHIAGKTLAEAALDISRDLESQKSALDEAAQRVVKSGLSEWLPNTMGGHLIVRGQAKLLEDISALEDLERIRLLFEALESRETILKLLNATEAADGMQIFIGSENKLFNHSGCSMILSPYKNADAKVIGAIGVIGPTRLNYGRIIPIVNYTSQLLAKLLG